MKLLLSFFSSTSKGKVCKLKKALYGLKQSPWAWFERFCLVILCHGYHQSQANYTLFIKHRDGLLTTLIVYVDDIVVIGNDQIEMSQLKHQFAQEFEIKDLGSLCIFWALRLLDRQMAQSFSMEVYTRSLNETGMTGCKPSDTLIDLSHRYTEDVGERLIDAGRYLRLVANLYISH